MLLRFGRQKISGVAGNRFGSAALTDVLAVEVHDLGKGHQLYARSRGFVYITAGGLQVSAFVVSGIHLDNGN